MSFSNVYYKRTAATAKACYVCYKPTTTVLATINTTDFVYACPAHLSDRGFATMLGGGGEDGARKTGATEEEIARVKEEWEEKQRQRKKKEEEDKSEKDKEGKAKEDIDKLPGALPATKPPPVHERYALHRDFFAMREREHRKRRQAAQARELAPRLPGAPRGVV